MPGHSAPRKRVRTGCLPCRRRKKKCGEEKPNCRNCHRNFLTCEWPGLVHQRQVRVREASLGQSDTVTGAGTDTRPRSQPLAAASSPDDIPDNTPSSDNPVRQSCPPASSPTGATCVSPTATTINQCTSPADPPPLPAYPQATQLSPASLDPFSSTLAACATYTAPSDVTNDHIHGGREENTFETESPSFHVSPGATAYTGTTPSQHSLDTTTNLTALSPECPRWIPRQLHFLQVDWPPSANQFLDYYLSVTVPQLVIYPCPTNENPFVELLLPVAFSHRLALDAVFAMVAAQSLDRLSRNLYGSVLSRLRIAL